MKRALLTVSLFVSACSPPMMTQDSGPPPCTPGTTTIDTIFTTQLGPGTPGNCVQCHGQGAGQGGLFFTDPQTFYAAMVDVKSKADPSTNRVTPGRPDLSHLVFRIQPGTDLLRRMPQGGSPLSAATVEAISGWICAGAPAPMPRVDGGVDAGTDAGTPDSGVDAGMLAITSFSPNAGVAGTHVTITGEGFSAVAGDNALRFGTVAAVVTSASTTMLETDVPETAVTAPLSVTVNGQTVTSATSFVVVPGAPVPTLSSILPTTIPVGSSDTALVVSGGGYRNETVVRVDGVAIPTTFASSARLDAVVPAAVLATAGTREVTVATIFNDGGAGGGISTPLSLSVTNPAPTLTTISPATVASGGAAFSLMVTGTNFVSSSVVELDGTGVTTTFNSATSLGAAMPSFASAGTHVITVRNPAPGGGQSTPLNLTVQTVVLPSISTLSPNPGPAGQSFTLTVAGANFACGGAGPSVLFDGGTFTTTTCSATSLNTTIPATAAGTSDVVVRNPSGELSSGVALTLVTPNPVPTISSLNPTSANSGSGAQTLAVSGTNFLPSSVVRYAGNARTTTFVDAGLVTAALSAADVATSGPRSVTVFNPAPGGGESAGQTFDVIFVNPVPTLSAVNPSSVVVNSSAPTLTLSGTGFVATSQATFDGSNRSSVFGSATSMTMTLTTADVSSPGTHSIVVTNPTPGGGASNSLTFTVGNAVPAITAISPCGVVAGAGATAITITGTNFLPGTTLDVGGTAVTPNVMSATQLTATIPGALLATAPSNRALAVVVTNPAPGGGAGAAFTFGVASASRGFATDVQSILLTNCGSSCHAAASQSGGLNLETNARANLVGVPSANCSTLTRVKACGSLPADSLLIDKLAAGQNATFPACGGPMPAAGSITATEFQTILDWVAQGAPP
ncbi:MAG: IPT/TIG domain-containing protein [Archangium sp.]